MGNRINEEKLLQLVGDGKTVTQIAQIFGVSPSAVTQRIQRLKVLALREEVNRPDVNVAGINFDGQMRKINAAANQMLETLITSDSEGRTVIERPELALKVMAELRQQMKTMADVAQSLYNIEGTKEFQETIIKAVGEEEPEVRERIINTLRKRSALARYFKSVSSF